MALFLLQSVDRYHQRRDILVAISEPGRVLLSCRQHRLVPANRVLDGIVRQPDLVRVLSFCTKLGYRPMAGKAAMAEPAKHIPAQTPVRHADGQFGFGAEGTPPTLARGLRTAHRRLTTCVGPCNVQR